MAMAALSTVSNSPEAEILREIEELLRKMATGEATPGDIQRLQDLQRRRVYLMSPRKLSDRDRRRAT